MTPRKAVGHRPINPKVGLEYPTRAALHSPHRAYTGDLDGRPRTAASCAAAPPLTPGSSARPVAYASPGGPRAHRGGRPRINDAGETRQNAFPDEVRLYGPACLWVLGGRRRSPAGGRGGRGGIRALPALVRCTRHRPTLPGHAAHPPRGSAEQASGAAKTFTGELESAARAIYLEGQAPWPPSRERQCSPSRTTPPETRTSSPTARAERPRSPASACGGGGSAAGVQPQGLARSRVGSCDHRRPVKRTNETRHHMTGSDTRSRAWEVGFDADLGWRLRARCTSNAAGAWTCRAVLARPVPHRERLRDPHGRSRGSPRPSAVQHRLPRFGGARDT